MLTIISDGNLLGVRQRYLREFAVHVLSALRNSYRAKAPVATATYDGCVAGHEGSHSFESTAGDAHQRCDRRGRRCTHTLELPIRRAGWHLRALLGRNSVWWLSVHEGNGNAGPSRCA